MAGLLAATILPIYSEVALGALALNPAYDVVALWAFATVGNTLGSCINWVLGRYLYNYRDRRWFPVRPRQIERASRWFQRWGAWSMLLAWTPFVGDPLTFVAGLLRMKFLPFVALVAVGKGVRYALLIWAVMAA